ncbi:unnamed protein product, partial [Ectocarpus fasciculatus]
FLQVGQSYGAARQPADDTHEKEASSNKGKERSNRRCKAADFFDAGGGGDDGNETATLASKQPLDEHHSTKHRRYREPKTRSSSKLSKKKSGKSRKRSRHERSSRSEDSTDDESSRQRRTKSADSRSQKLFIEDRRGDPDNLSFGKFYRLDVPLYDGMNDAAGSRKSRRKVARYFGSHVRGASAIDHQERLQLWKGDKRRDHTLAWTHAVSSRTFSGGDGTMPTAGGMEHKKQRVSNDFLPVTPVVAPVDERATNGKTAEQDGVQTESLEQWVARKTKEFNRATRERPESDDIWLKYADFQEDAVRALHGGHTLQPPTAAIVRMTLEKRASVLEGALRQNPFSVRLRIPQLHLAAQMQEHIVVDSLWRAAIEKSNQSCTLWLRYLQFKASHFASFSVTSQRSIYARCLRALESKREQAMRAHEQDQRAKGVFIMANKSMLDGEGKETAAAERNLLDALWSYCVFEKASGYHERALGVLQAMVELNTASATVSLDTFVSFWDSEAPRIGDVHPTQAGMTRWLETAGTASSKPSGSALQTGQGKTVAPRKHGTARTMAVRGKRKRAVDFFKEDLPAETCEQPTATGGTEVLEKAYQKAQAMAMAAVPIVRADASPHADPSSDDDAKDDSGQRPQSETLREGLSGPESTQKDTAGSKGSSPEVPAPDAVGEHMSPVQRESETEGARAVEAEGLIWLDDEQRTAYSVRHGYRIDVQGAQDSVSGHEYGRILSSMRGGGAVDEDEDNDVEVAAAASKRLRYRGAREREAEIAKQAAVLQDVPEGDVFSDWAKAEDEMTQHQWQPVRSIQDAERAEDQPDRVVFIEDLQPFLFRLSHAASISTLVGLLFSVGGLVHPRSDVSHSPKLMSEACCAGSFGDGGLSGSLLSSVSNGLQAVWRASEGDLPVSGTGVVGCTGRPGSCLPPPVVSTAADQFLLLTDDVVADCSRQAFLRNVLHHLVRAPASLPSTVSGSNILVQLQCTLIMFEGYLASATGARHGRFSAGSAPKQTRPTQQGTAWSDEDTHGHEARKVAKSLLEASASQASATDLRLWSSYVQLLALLGSTQEAIKVAEKALSMVQALPEDKKGFSAELFWLTFRLHAGLPLSPRDPHPGEDDETVGNLFEAGNKGRHGREMALLVLCSFAEGGFNRPKSKSKRSKRDGKGSSAEPILITPPRLLAARKLMADRVAREAAQEVRRDVADGALDMTPPFMYHAIAWVWMEFLSVGLDAAEDAMSKCLELAQPSTPPTGSGEASGVPAESSRSSSSFGIGGTSTAGNKPYTWNVVPEHMALGVCLERMHRGFSELVTLAQRYNPVDAGPRRVRAVLLRGLASFPAEPGMLCMLLDTEQLSSSQQRLVHHLFEVSRRRALLWEQGPTPLEWILSTTHQVMRCVREARQTMIAAGGTVEHIDTTAPAYRRHNDEALRVKNWLPGSYSRLKRSMESAITHPTGRGIPVLWRMYICCHYSVASSQAMRGNFTQAKQLFWRAVHACPGNKAVWMDALRGSQRDRVGAAGLRPAFRTKELNEAIDALLEKSLHLRAEPP